jgi:NADPH-dependent curcumin reductase CurA
MLVRFFHALSASVPWGELHMTADRTSVSRRGLFGAAGKATVVAGVAGGLTAPFRSLGGVAWAAQTPAKVQKWVLAKNVGDDLKLTVDHFKLVEEAMPAPKQGEALIKVVLCNIHSSTRNLMKVKGSTKVGETDKTNYACATVIQSRDKTYREGDLIACQAGWNTYQITSSDWPQVGSKPEFALVDELNGTLSRTDYVFRPVMVRQFKPDVLMDVFGTSGLTAYYGMRECGPIMPSDKIAVAGTTGSVGAIAAQIVKAKGAYVVGFGGGADRAKWVTDTLGIDKALDYRAKDLDAQLKAAFPNGIDVYCDGVGGPLSESIAKLMNQDSRYFSYGSSAAIYADLQPDYKASAAKSAGMFGMSQTVADIIKARNIKLEAWNQAVWAQDRIEAENKLSQLMNTGKLKAIHHVVKGFENAPKGILSQYDGSNPYGKLQLQFAD